MKRMPLERPLIILAAAVATGMAGPLARAESTPEQELYWWQDEIRTVAFGLSQARTGRVSQWPRISVPAGTATLPIPRASGAVRADGKLDETAWQRATQFPVGPVFDDWQQGPFMLSVSVCRDEQHVYLAIESPRDLKGLGALTPDRHLFTIGDQAFRVGPDGGLPESALGCADQVQVVELALPLAPELRASFAVETQRSAGHQGAVALASLGMDQLAAPSDKRSQFRAPWLWLDPFAVRLVPADVAVRLSCEMSAEGPLRLVSTTIQSGKPGTTSELPLTCGPEGAVYRYDWKQDVGGRVWSAEGCFYVEPVLPTLAAARDVLRRAGRLLVSDGVTEAFSPQGEAFGRARLAALFAECRAHSATETARRIDEALSTHRGYQAPLDDTTLVAIEFTLPAAERIGTQQAPFHRLTGEQPVRNQLVALGLASSAETRKTQRITGSRGPGRTTGADRCG